MLARLEVLPRLREPGLRDARLVLGHRASPQVGHGGLLG
jgi:hypothetical protein